MAATLSIAVVEDNDDLRAAMVAALMQEGHKVTGIDSAEAMVEQAGLSGLDLIVLDLGLPGEDGLTLARRIREAQPNLGIIMVTARGRPQDRLAGYQNGADIYMTKPVSLEELAAAIEALSRRLRRQERLEGDAYRLDMRSLTLSGSLGTVAVSAIEAGLLAAFARAPDGRLETWQILELTDPEQKTQSRSTVNVTIFRLSRRLRQAGESNRPIRAIRGWGYQLCEPLRLQ